jgi:hypothetical protein
MVRHGAAFGISKYNLENPLPEATCSESEMAWFTSLESQGLRD